MHFYTGFWAFQVPNQMFNLSLSISSWVPNRYISHLRLLRNLDVCPPVQLDPSLVFTSANGITSSNGTEMKSRAKPSFQNRFQACLFCLYTVMVGQAAIILLAIQLQCPPMGLPQVNTHTAAGDLSQVPPIPPPHTRSKPIPEKHSLHDR